MFGRNVEGIFGAVALVNVFGGVLGLSRAGPLLSCGGSV